MTTSTVRDELQRLYDEHGTLTPALVVQAATNPTHPLHDRFEWDDTEAARRWRLEQSAQLIRSVKIKFVTRSGEPADLRAFTAVRRDDAIASEYVPTEDVVTDPLVLKITIRAMERDWRLFQRRYENLQEFAAFIAAQVNNSSEKAS